MAVVLSWAWPSHFCTMLTGDTSGDSRHPEPMPESLGTGLRTAAYAGGIHHRLNLPPSRRAAHAPQADVSPVAAPLLKLTDAMHQVEGVEQRRRDGHAAVHALATLLEGFKNDQSAGKIDAIDRQRERFRDAAAGEGQHAAERAHIARCPFGSSEKRFSFIGRQIFPLAILIKQLS